MEKMVRSLKADQYIQQPKVLYIDGCKVTIKFSSLNNPSAIKNIKDTLISSGTTIKK